MDAEFSIVIPYHAIPETVDFVKRQLNYYHVSSIHMFIILAVSGDEVVKFELEQFIKKINNKRFVMFTVNESNIKSVKSWAKKIFNALTLVKTRYVIINGADDIIIPEVALHGTKILANNLDVAAAKGHTIYFNCHSGSIFLSRDLGIYNNCFFERLKLAMKDRDSIFYIIRRTEDLVREYQNIVDLSTKSEIVGNSFYHVEHFKALSLAALGKVYILDLPWRIQTSHKNNHTSHTQASFVRVQSGILDKNNYEWFKSVTKNMSHLSYAYYKFLWVCHQITGISVTFKQIIYNFIYKKCGLIDSIHVFMYFMLNKIYVFLQKILPEQLFKEKPKFYGSAKDFVQSEHYAALKKHYFSENDIKLLESQTN